jgi:DNA replication licensing factor MCM2
VELTDAIISRFDILCVVRDTVDRDLDAKLASFVVGSHVQAHPNYDEDDPVERWDSSSQLHEKNVERLDQDLLKKYLVYAKQTCSPHLSNIDTNKLATVFSDLRKE